jgi:hypothetical protein
MTRLGSSSRILGIVLGLSLTLVPARARAATLYVYKASLTLPATMVIVRPTESTDLIVNRKLAAKDIVNLALGRPLGTKVDSKTEILAAAITFEPPSMAPHARLIVFDPSQNGIAQQKTIVAKLTDLDYATAYLSSKSQGLGTATAQIQATTLGDPAHNGFLVSTLQGGGLQSGAHLVGGNSNPKISQKGSLQGRLKFVTTEDGVTTPFDGFVVNGQFKFSGGFIGLFDE